MNSSYQDAMAVYNALKGVNDFASAKAAQDIALSTYPKKTTGNKNKNDPWIPAGQEDKVSVTVTPQPEYGMEWTDWLSLIFPPALLWKATDPTPMGGDPMPVTTVTGSPDALSNFLEQSPIIQTTPAAADPLSGIGGILDLTIKILPLILVVGVFSSIKKVF